MNREDIIRMAKEAEAWSLVDHDGIAALERFANLVAAEEREACAKTAMELLFVYIGSYPINEQFADAIRERGKG
jgi:hypothetical protein